MKIFFFNIYLLFWLLWILVEASELLVEAHGIEFPVQGLNLGFLHWKHKVLVTGPPGRSRIFFF